MKNKIRENIIATSELQKETTKMAKEFVCDEKINVEVEFLFKEDLMRLLDIKEDKALKLLKSQMLDSVKIGKTYVTKREWLDEFFERNKNKSVELY